MRSGAMKPPVSQRRRSPRQAVPLPAPHCLSPRPRARRHGCGPRRRRGREGSRTRRPSGTGRGPPTRGLTAQWCTTGPPAGRCCRATRGSAPGRTAGRRACAPPRRASRAPESAPRRRAGLAAARAAPLRRAPLQVPGAPVPTRLPVAGVRDDPGRASPPPHLPFWSQRR